MFDDLFSFGTRAPRRKSTRMRDSQRQKMYNWEARDVMPMDRSLTGKSLTFEESKALVEKIFKSHGMNVPAVMLKRDRVSVVASYYHRHPRTWAPAIVLTHRGLTLSTVLHECAHGVKYKYMDDNNKEAGHGPLFVRVYMDLLVKYCKLDITELRRTAKLRKLKVAPRPQYDIAVQTRGTIPAPKPATVKPAIAAKAKPKAAKPKTTRNTVKLSTGTTITWIKPRKDDD